jgi:N-acyl-D-amino-acid deacylase
VIDGTGKPGFAADVGVRDGRIVAVGKIDEPASRVLDAQGCVVSPGFIDIHSHTDEMILANPRCESKSTQGVTLEVSGNCGDSSAPRGGKQPHTEGSSWLRECGVTATWGTMQEYLDVLDANPMANNFATLVGHGTVREVAVGYDDRPPTDEELDEMRRRVQEAMEAGAFGVSSGLIYPPGCYGTTEEVIELCKVAARYGGIYTTHMRNEAEGVVQALEEALRIGRESGAGVQISHHKACGVKNWGLVKESLALIDAARAEGTDVLADQYPYVATSTGLGIMLPKWAHDGGTKALVARLSDPVQRARLREAVLEDMEHGYLAASGGWDTVVLSSLRNEHNKYCEGLSIAKIAEHLEKDPVDTALDLLLEEGGSIGMMHFVIGEDDVNTVMKHPAVVIASDATARTFEGPMTRGKPHPRAYGTFARVLGKYTREDGILTLEQAVAKMTGMPARRLGLKDRGVIAPDNWADLTVFDPDKIEDVATFEKPVQSARGIRYVIVNGETILEDGAFTGAMPGKVLRHM